MVSLGRSSLLLCCLLLALCVRARAGSGSLSVGTSELGLALDENRGYALASVWVGGVEFPGGGVFPGFTLYDATGKEEAFRADDPRWQTESRQLEQGVRIRYTCEGFSADVDYELAKGILTITATPREETSQKVRLLSDGGRLVSIPDSLPGAAATGFLIKPHCSGELIHFPADKEVRETSEAQSWTYQASFFGLGYNGHGLIVRFPQYGGVWTAGTGDVNGAYSLYGGVATDFRPRHDDPARTTYPFWEMPLVEPKLELQLVPVADINGDGVFNWVDVGVTYREKFIKRNLHLDKSELESVGGKIDIADQFEGNLNYSQLIEQIRTLDFAKQRWWLVGAHTAPGRHFCDPPFTDSPDASHDGPGGYDYFAFKCDAAAAGAKIGLHEMFQDTSPSCGPGWDSMPLKRYETGDLAATFGGEWNGRDWIDYGKALNVMVADGSFFHTLDAHLKRWQVGAGDTWHWDVLTAQGGSSDFSLDHPTTHGADLRTRIKILRHFEQKGIYMTSEGLQEGLCEHCDFSYVAQADPLFKSQFAAGEVVPLIPVLFQGRTYYSPGWGSTAWTLLHGAKAQWESVAPADREVWLSTYFGSVVFWAQIADRTVSNLIKTPKGWDVLYTEGGRLVVDLSNETPGEGILLELDGKRYTPDNPPPSISGITGRRVEGKYVPTYPPGWNGP